MSTDILAQARLFMAMSRRINDPGAALSASEEAALAALMAPTQGGDGFPAGPAGDARGTNAMRRANWFNGRFLTAEALRRQDGYFDIRARLDAHLLMPGVAYGLGLTASGLNGLPVLERDGSSPPERGGFARAQAITLSPGLAFDHVGRPILVSQPFAFTLQQLITLYRQTPRRVAPGGTEFAPCVCLVPEPRGPTGGPDDVKPGCYLLIIEPGELPEGEAKVYGEACAGTSTSICQSDSWRGSFGLSLVRVPLDVPEETGLNTAWALRGTASAWWFDVFEHSLIKRWDPAFAMQGDFAAPVGPGRHEGGAVALAMVWLGTDGSAIFLDRWIPRRSIVATPGEDWHRTTFGAPPRAAAWARIHQFQAMLDESLDKEPLLRTGRLPALLNLWQRGFRHIPPIGFLPLDPAAIGAHRDDKGTTGLPALDRIIAAGGGRIALVAGLIAAAKSQAYSYFRGTTVMPYCVVALHDDDILEDLGNVFDKDPVRVARRVLREAALRGDAVRGDAARDVAVTHLQTAPAAGFLEQLGEIFDVLDLDDLVNRTTEIVKVIIPLQGLMRAHPILGVVPEDAQAQVAAWLGAQPPAWWTRANRLTDAASMARLQQSMPLAMLPRHFAVYVKQRLVLLDVLVMVLELLQAMVILARDTQRDATPPTKDVPVPTAGWAAAYAKQPAEKRMLVEAAFAEPLVRDAVARAAVAATPDLRLPARNAAFSARVQQIEAQLAPEFPDQAARQQAALARAADAYAAEHPGFEVMQIIAAVQPPAQARATFDAIAAHAVEQPLRDPATGAPVDATVADAVVKDGPVVFDKPEATAIYAAMNRAVAEKPADAYVAGAPAGVTAGEILAKTPEEAERTLGDHDKLAAFTAAVAKEKEAAATAARTLTATAPPPDVVAKVSDAVAGGQDAAAAVEAAKASVRTDRAKVAYLDAVGTMIRTLGADRTLQIARLRAAAPNG